MNFDVECKASDDLALAIAAALGLPGHGRLVSLSIDFSANQPATVVAGFHADPSQLAAGLLTVGEYKLVPLDPPAHQEARHAA